MKQIEFLNEIRKWSSDLYQDRIPEATRNNLAEIQGIIIDDADVRNEFYDIMNKVGKTILRQRMFRNPLKSFRKEKLTTGNIVEEIGLDKVMSKAYDKNDTNVFATNRPDMKALYNFENRRSLYDTTRNIEQLRGAFQSEDGLMNFVDSYVSNLYNSQEIDEFLIMKEFFKAANYCEVNIPELDGTAEKYTSFIQAVKKYSGAMTFPSRDYNELGFLQTTNIQDLRLIVVKEIMDELDVRVLASMFNKDLAQFNMETMLVDNFNDDSDCYAIICDKDFLEIYDTLITSRDVENPRTLDMTFIFHVWQNIFTSKFLQAVKIRKEVAPTSATISDATASLSIAGAGTKTLSITETAPANASYTQYEWTSADPTKVEITSQDNTSCKIKVVGGSATNTVVITATNKGDESITATCTVTLTV